MRNLVASVAPREHLSRRYHLARRLALELRPMAFKVIFLTLHGNPSAQVTLITHPGVPGALSQARAC